MQKYFFAIPCALSGILLCALNKSAFIALAILISIAGVVAGAFLLYKSYNQKGALPVIAFLIISLSISFFIVNIVFWRTSIVVGGIFFLAAGIISIILFNKNLKLFLPFCGGCFILALLLIFLPLWAGILSFIGGIFLIFYGGVFIFYL